MEKVSNPLISIIIPAYNVEEYISKCIDSILNQTYKNLEIILVDDGSIDKSGKICDFYKEKDNRIKVIHKENGGLSDARNTGIRESTGKYISFIDSDDYVDNTYIEELYNLILNDNVDMAITSHKIIGSKIKAKYKRSKFTETKEKILDKMLYDEDVDVSAWGKLYNKKLFDNVEFPKGRLYEDTATFYKLVDKCDYISVNNIPTYNYVIRSNSISQNSFSIKKLDIIKSTEEMTEFIKNKYPNLVNGCKRRLMFAYLSTLTQLTKNKKRNKKIEKKLFKYINENRKEVLSDKRIPKRDRIALIISIFGFNIFKFFWKTYEKLVRK